MTQPPVTDLATFRRRNGWLLVSVAGFSAAVNLLMLTGPLYMLQVYDRVLGSGSEETLLALSILVTFLFLMMGVLDFVRGRIAARYGARLQENLDARVFEASLQAARRTRQPQTGLRDIAMVQRLCGSPVFMAVFDLPWTPLFIAAIFVFHPWLGWVALLGGAVLVALTLANQRLSRAPLDASASAGRQSDRMAEDMQTQAEAIGSLGMTQAALDRWRSARRRALDEGMRGADRVGGFTTMTRTLRLFLQSAILGVGAYLVLQGSLTAGAMIAASILLGRALAPVELAIGQWAMIAEAAQGRRRLKALLASEPVPPPRMALPRPSAQLDITRLSVVPPGAALATLTDVSLRVLPGEAVGVIGPTGSGKSTLARAVTGVWPPAAGQVRLDGATLDQYDPDALGSYIGYLPQTVRLFDGTIAENIARLSEAPDGDKVVEAAMRAAAHEMILDLPHGYDTPLHGNDATLSGGQLQRIGLARALYGDPVLLVLDEPNSALDNDGSVALNTAVKDLKAKGGAALIMAHRPSAIHECEKLLVLQNGKPAMFGPTQEVLKKTMANYADLRVTGKTPGGVT